MLVFIFMVVIHLLSGNLEKDVVIPLSVEQRNVVICTFFSLSGKKIWFLFGWQAKLEFT